jgi:hypothetical protein
VKTLQSASIEELNYRGYDGHATNPGYFPTVEDYGGCLAAARFEVRYIALIPRPTPLPGDAMGWLVNFCGCFTSVLPEAEREEYISRACANASSRTCATQMGNGLRTTGACVSKRTRAHRQCG